VIDPHAVVNEAVRQAPRRYRMPPLPADAPSSHDADTALAFAIEAARGAAEKGDPPPAEAFGVFARSLGTLIRIALDEQAGDPAFRALVLHAHDAEVQEHVRLASTAHADRRQVRAAVDAIAHPGKLAALPPGAGRDALSHLHALAREGSWSALAEHAARAGIDSVAASDALARLARGEALGKRPAVMRFLALRSGAGPLAGTDSAAAQGRASARTGDRAEEQALAAFAGMAALLDSRTAPGAFLACRGLRVPPAFPGDPRKAKDEWDAALLRVDGRAADILLLAEVKASPAAATPDFTRLHRGLLRLAEADPARVYAFASASGSIALEGASLRALAPLGRQLPPHVVYCCTAAAEASPPPLAAAAKAVLLAEPASLAYAQRVAGGDSPPDSALHDVWLALASEPRLRAALYQFDTACAVRERMLHPDDLLAAFRQAVTG